MKRELYKEEYTVEESLKRLFSLLEKLEIPADKIESRPYAAFLHKAHKT